MGKGIMSISNSSSRLTRSILGKAVAAASMLLLPALASAGSSYLPDPDALTLTPAIHQEDAAQGDSDQPLFLDAAPAMEQPNIHGFFNSPFKTAYVTPRGLVVQNKGLVWQPVVGLVFPLGDAGPIKNLTFVGGIWNSVDTYEERFNATTGAVG